MLKHYMKNRAVINLQKKFSYFVYLNILMGTLLLSKSLFAAEYQLKLIVDLSEIENVSTDASWLDPIANPASNNEFFVAQDNGVIFSVDSNNSSKNILNVAQSLDNQTFISLSALVFHPSFAKPEEAGYATIFTAHTGKFNQETRRNILIPKDKDMSFVFDFETVITAWKYDFDTQEIDPTTQREVLRIPIQNKESGIQKLAFDPFQKQWNPDYGQLYFSLNYQDNLQQYPLYSGAILRIHPLTFGARNYTVSASNPFIKEPKINNEIVLLVDNLNYKDTGDNIERIKKLEAFIDNYSNVKVIATGDGDISTGVPPIDYIEYCKIAFKSLFIQNLRSKEIKSIIKLWIPDEDNIKMEDRLDKMVSDFSSFSLPSNAMSVSLFLWSTEHSDRKPINNSVLLDIYIEIILEKLNKDNIYRGSFDFTNKIQLLASIAQEMLISGGDNYSLLYSDYVRVIDEYLAKVGFQYESDKIADYFVRRKLFAKFQGNRIKFSQSCFFHFFLGKRMEFNPDFRDYVMSEENYCKYIHEIDYYTGLVRSDKDLLKTIFDRFKKEFSKTDHVFPQLEGIWDRFFIVKSKSENESDQEIKFTSAAKTTEIAKIKENRPSEEMIEEFQNRRLSQIIEPGKILKKNGNVNLEVLLILMSVVLRNSETVEDIKLKKQIYASLVKYTMIWTALYREHIIDYILKHDRLPPTLPTNVSVRRTLANLPLHVQSGMSKWVGTPKLAKVILSKIESDFKGNSYTKSDLELFFSVALYGDIQGADYPKYFKKLIKQLKNTPVRDFTFFKLIYYYYRRTRDGSPNEDLYLDMISDLKMKELNMPNKMKQQVIKSYRTAKKNLFG